MITELAKDTQGGRHGLLSHSTSAEPSSSPLGCKTVSPTESVRSSGTKVDLSELTVLAVLKMDFILKAVNTSSAASRNGKGVALFNGAPNVYLALMKISRLIHSKAEGDECILMQVWALHHTSRCWPVAQRILSGLK